MNITDLYQQLESLGLPISYYSFDSDEDNPPPKPPYIIYLFTNRDDFYADNRNYVDIENYQVELYTTKKDIASELLIENKLKELEIPYSKFETKIESEGLYQIVYEIQLI